MKMTRRDFLNVSTAAAVVCAATLLPVEKAAAAQQTLAAQNLLEQAYLYAFPLVIMDATRTASTNTRTATSNKAPINQFIHAEKLADATTRAVVTPNVDTIYTQAFLDVGAEPMIYGVPQTDRFFNVQVLDAWTNTAAVLETPGLYAITRADWQGELPEGVQRISAVRKPFCFGQKRTTTRASISGWRRSQRSWSLQIHPTRRRATCAPMRWSSWVIRQSPVRGAMRI